jgi:[protein-PII] uridylyltransferase
LQLTALQTDLVDSLILELYEQAVAALGLERAVADVALIAHGGYGRRDLAPYSDCDLMLTPRRRATQELTGLASRLSRDIVDAGLDLGFSVRTPEQACHLAWGDPTIFSSLSESRLLTGSVQTFGRFFRSLRLGAHRRHRGLIDRVYAARRDERRKWGETGYLLRPNVKRSRGGLRDIQLVRWLGFARFGDSDPDKLLQLGALSEDDFTRLRSALTFLLRLRNEIHFDSQRNQDVLDRPAQLRIAERWGYQSHAGRLPVEAFMREYFEHTREVRYVAAHFYDTVRYRPLRVRSLDVLLSRKLGDDFRIGPYHIWVRDARLGDVAGDLPRVLKLMALANQHQRRISHRTWQAIREAMRKRQLGPPDASAARLFLALLNRPGRLADLLRRLHELRVLEQMIPAMGPARCLLQFNEYHKYTVDAHSIRAVEAATALSEDRGRPGEIYRQLDQPWLLHLSLLIHDLGKGSPRDHCELGREIAAETADLLGLGEPEKQTLQTLVLHHLLMIHTALRHDLNDHDVIQNFAETIETPEVLDLLYLHSLSDLTAVGPGVLTEWKRRLIGTLHERAWRYLREGRTLEQDDQVIRTIRERITDELQRREIPEEALRLLAQLPGGMLEEADVTHLADDLARAARLDPQHPVYCRGVPLPDQGAVEYTILFLQGGRRVGFFMALTGALMSLGLRILRSRIETFDSGLAWDQFVVQDPDWNPDNPDPRIAEVCAALRTAVSEGPRSEPKFRRHWRQQSPAVASELQVLPYRVKFDNATSQRYTVLSIYAYDRPGLLYALARAIARNDLAIHFAKISTSLDQAVDVFYVTYRDGGRIEDPRQQAALRDQFLEAARPPR